jgi:outer membrane immunogenic protein
VCAIELLFSNKGFKYRQDSSSTTMSKTCLCYLNLPVLVGFRPVDKLRLFLGTEVGYLIDATSKPKDQKYDVSYLWDNKFDFGIALGTSYLLITKMDIDMRYTYGLSSVIKDVVSRGPNNEPISRPKFQNRTLQFSFFYTIK